MGAHLSPDILQAGAVKGLNKSDRRRSVESISQSFLQDSVKNAFNNIILSVIQTESHQN